MPKVTCPECDTPFETVSPRYTGCPGCGSRLDVRDPRDPVAVGEPTRSPRTTSPYDVSFAEVKQKKPTKSFSGPIVVRKNNDDVPKVMILLIVLGVVGLFSVVLGVGVIVYHVVGSGEPRAPTNLAPAVTPSAGGQFPTAVKSGDDGNIPLPPSKSGLPGVDPGELPQGPDQIGDDELARMLPPGFFPGAPSPPRPPVPPRMPGAPGAPRMPVFPGGPGNAPPAPVSIVTLSNLRDAKGFAGSPELHVDFVYAPGSAPALFDTLVLTTGNSVSNVRLNLVGQTKGTISVRLFGPRNPAGAVTEAWLERRVSPAPNALGQKISNSVTK